MRLQKSIPLLHPTGLHLRPAKRIWDVANQYQADIRLTYNKRTANAKSLLDMVALGVLPGATLIFETEGADAEQALTAIETLMRDVINAAEDT